MLAARGSQHNCFPLNYICKLLVFWFLLRGGVAPCDARSLSCCLSGIKAPESRAAWEPTVYDVVCDWMIDLLDYCCIHCISSDWIWSKSQLVSLAASVAQLHCGLTNNFFRCSPYLGLIFWNMCFPRICHEMPESTQQWLLMDKLWRKLCFQNPSRFVFSHNNRSQKNYFRLNVWRS